MKESFKNTFLALSRNDLNEFNKYKSIHHKKYNAMVVTAATLLAILFFISDCMLVGGMSYKTLNIRLFAIVPVIIYILVYKYDNSENSWKHLATAAHVVGHIITWCVAISAQFLPDSSILREGFLLMQVVVMMIGVSSPFSFSIISQIILFFIVLIVDSLMNYAAMGMVLATGVPMLLGLILSNYILTQIYYETYILNKKLERMSYFDQLTGVYNRHKLDDIKDICLPGEYSDRDISFILIDIDFFKKVNDTYGHDKGDIVLKELAEVLKSNTADTDLVIRWGGEEFLIILFDKNVSKAIDIAEDLRAKVENNKSRVCDITISLGVSEYINRDYKKSINNADKALYEAKRTGRNRAIIYKDL